MLKKIIGMGILLILGVSVFCGCESVSEADTEVETGAETEKNYYTLREAEENGWFTHEDWMNIAYYYHLQHGFDAESLAGDPDFTPKPLEELSAETELKIKEAYLKELQKEQPSRKEEIKIEDIEMISYYGIYNDYAVVRMYSYWKSYGDPIFVEKIFGGVTFYDFCGMFYNVFKIN